MNEVLFGLVILLSVAEFVALFDMAVSS